MKTWLIAITGLIIFVGLAVFVQYRIEDTSKHLDYDINKVNFDLTKQHWDQTLKELQTIKEKWQRTKPLWAMLLHHNEIDSIDQALIRALIAIQCKDYSEAQIELGSLQHFIQHIPEHEKFSLVNIL
jgi:hypothetical protein